MSERVQEYWRRVRNLEAKLRSSHGSWLHIVSLDTLEKKAGGGRSGVICEASAFQAARQIVEGTHRLATPEEIEVHQTAQKFLEVSSKREELARNGIALIGVPPPAA